MDGAQYQKRETVKLARELARLRGEGFTEALTAVLRREVTRERRKPRRDDIEERLRRIDDIGHRDLAQRI